MKKFVSLMLMLCMLCGVAAFADIQYVTEESASMTLTLELEGGYVVEIPSELTFEGPHRVDEQDEASAIYYKAEGNLIVSQAYIDEANLVIYTDSANNFSLTNPAGNAISYTYTPSFTTGEGEVLTDQEMVVPRYKTAEFALTFQTESKAEAEFIGGTFSDTLTFRIALEGQA